MQQQMLQPINIQLCIITIVSLSSHIFLGIRVALYFGKMMNGVVMERGMKMSFLNSIFELLE